MKSKSRPKRAKGCLREFQMCSIVGLKADQCHLLPKSIHTVSLRKSSTKDSQVISLPKVLTRQEVGSIP